MMTQRSNPNLTGLTVCTLFSFWLSLPAYTAPVDAEAGQAENAAGIDWVPRAELSASELRTLPPYCAGRYVQPPAFIVEPAADGKKQPIEATAASGEHVRGGTTTLSGDVEVRQGQRLIKSPRIRLAEDRKTAYVSGPLTLREPDVLLTGSHATLNLVNGSGLIDNASFLFHEPGIRGEAATLDRQPNDDLVLTQARFTRCAPMNNTWAITGRDIRLDPDAGFGTARNVTVHVKDVPVMWVPWIRFPITDERQSGFLFPGLSQNNDSGTDITIPWYFNLAPNYDATYALRTMSNRGILHDGELRWLTHRTENQINAAYLPSDDEFDERRLFDETTGGTTAGFDKEERWLLHVSHTGVWSPRWRTSVSYSTVSDIEYLSDFGGDVGATAGGELTSSTDRNLSDRRSAFLNRKGEVEFRGDKWTWSLLAQGFQSLELERREQYERLPRLAGDYAGSLSVFDLDLGLEYTYFHKDNEGLRGRQAIIGHRAVVDAGVSTPFRTVWGFVEPAVGMIHRSYYLQDTPADARTDPQLTTPVVSLDAGLFFDRFFEFGGTGFQQTLEPRIFYLYVEEDQQDDLPSFEATPLTPGFSQLFRENRFSGVDRLGDANQVSVGLTTRLLREDSGAEFFSASIGQIYHFKDRDVVFRSPAGVDNEADSSPIFTEATLNLGNGLRVTGSYEWEPRENRSNRGKLSLKYRPDARRIFNLSYINANEEVENLGQFRSEEESDVSFIWAVANRWSVIGRWNYNWDERQTIESLFGFEYNDCCWKARLVFRRFLKRPRSLTMLVDDPGSPGGVRQISRIDSRADSGVFLEFQLKGLATVGRKLDSLLEEAIAGYRARQ